MNEGWGTRVAQRLAGIVVGVGLISITLAAPSGAGTLYGPAQKLAFSGLNGPSGVAVDESGDVFVSDTGSGQVLELPAGGTQRTVATGYRIPTGLSVDGQGDLFIAVYSLTVFGNGQVAEVPPGGSPATLFSARSAIGVARDPAGDTFVASLNPLVDPGSTGEVDEYKPGYVNVLHPYTVLGFTGINPHDVVLDAAGDVFVSTDTRVVELSAAGVQTTVIGGLSKAGDLAIDTAGDLLVADSGSGNIVELPAGGSPVTIATLAGEPNGIAVDAAGDVFVSEATGNTVVELPALVGTTLRTLPGFASFGLGVQSAKLTRTDNGAPLPGETVAFSVRDPLTGARRSLCSAVTGPSGVATCAAPVPLLNLLFDPRYTATFAGAGRYLPSTAAGRLV